MPAAPKIAKRPKTGAKLPALEGKKTARKPRKPPLERAARVAELLERKADLLSKNVSRWTLPADETLAEHVRTLQTVNMEIKARATEIGETLAALLDCEFAPSLGGNRGGRAPLSLRNLVTIRANRYEPGIYGEVNQFRFLGYVGRYCKIEALTEGAKEHYVLRNWIRMETESTGEVAD